MEGTGAFIALWWGGVEVVYDFATMDRQRFYYIGTGINDAVFGGGVSEYAGFVFGLPTDRNLAQSYRGNFSSISIGVGSDIYEQVVGVSAGVTGFISWTDPKILGIDWYVGGSLAFDLVPIFDVGIGMNLFFTPIGEATSYVRPDGTVDETSLLLDIALGTDSPWLIPLGDIGNFSRALGIASAIHYVWIYEDMHSEIP